MKENKSKSRLKRLLVIIGAFVLGNMTRPLADGISTISSRIFFQEEPKVAIDIDRIDPVAGNIYVMVQNATERDIICKYLDISDYLAEPKFYDRLNPRKRGVTKSIDSVPSPGLEEIKKGSANLWGLIVGQTGITAVPVSSRVIPKGNTQIVFTSPALLNYPLEVTPRYPPIGAVNLGFSMTYQYDLGEDGDCRATLYKVLHNTRIK